MPTLLQAQRRQARCYLARAERLARNFEALTRDRSSLLLALQSALDLELYDNLIRGSRPSQAFSTAPATRSKPRGS